MLLFQLKYSVILYFLIFKTFQFDFTIYTVCYYKEFNICNLCFTNGINSIKLEPKKNITLCISCIFILQIKKSIKLKLSLIN